MKNRALLYTLILLAAGAAGLLLYTFLFASASAPGASSGTSDARFSVNSDGAAQYSIPIETPPGTRDMAPSLSLVYSSQGGNGLLGKGFALQGLSKITRTGATPAQDGFKGGVAYDENDRFALDGKRLMNINNVAGGYGGDGALYYTELQGWARTEASGSCGTGPCSFTVTLKNGMTAEYGTGGGAQVYAVGERFNSGSLQGTIRQWLLNRVTDLNGNALEIAYSDTPRLSSGERFSAASGKGQAYPDRISYTIADSLSARRFVDFFYETRTDTVTQYTGGGNVQTLLRLTDIRTSVIDENQDTVVVKNYTLNYDPDAPLNISRLLSVQEFDGNNRALPPVQMNWTDGPNGMVTQNINYRGNTDNSGWTGDFNGDGRTDILTANSDQTELDSLYLATPSGFQKGITPGINLDNQCPWIGDFNGDGRADLLTLGNGQGNLYLSNGQGFDTTIPVSNLMLPSDCTDDVWISDFNGDGRADLLTLDGIALTMYLANGKGFQAGIPVDGVDMEGLILPADYNGDGLTDLFASDANGSGNLWLSNFSESTSFETSIPVSGLPFNGASINPDDVWVGDFNNDGLADIFSQVGTAASINYANGQGFQAYQSISSIALESNCNCNWVGDYNGDGYTDVYVNGNNSPGTLYYFNGTDFDHTPAPDNSLDPNNAWRGDFNGDGTTDFFWADISPAFFLSADTTAVSITQDHLPNLVTSVSNGIGGMINIGYQPLTNGAVYTPGKDFDTLIVEGPALFGQYHPAPLDNFHTPMYPVQNVQDAMYVVSGYTKSDGMGDVYPYGYTYAGAKADMNGYGWLGFRSRVLADSSVQTLATTYYHQAFPLSGKTDSSTVYTFKNQQMQRKRMGYRVSKTAYTDQQTVFEALTTRSRTDYFDLGEYAFTTGTDYAYDDFGNPRLVTRLGDTTNTWRIVYTINAYDNDTANWQLGYLLQTTVSPDSLGNQVLAQTTITYDTPTRNITQKQYRVNASQSVTFGYRYDSYGNNTHTISPAGDTTRVVYDDLYHSFPAQRITPPNQWGKKLTTNYQYDPRFGIPVQVTDPNGNSIVVVPDGFGRDSLVQGPDPQGEMVTLSAMQYQSGSGGVGYQTRQLVRQDWEGSQWDTLQSSYDGLMRLRQTATRGQDNRLVITESTYNSEDRVISRTAPYFQDSTVFRTRIYYDPYNRIARIVRPLLDGDSTVTQATYQGKTVSVTRALGTADQVQSLLKYDYFNGRRRFVLEQYENGDSIHFHYDLLGRSSRVVDPQRISSRLFYDDLGRKIKMVTASLGEMHYIYNDSLRTLSTVNAKQDTVSYTFDALRRVLVQELSSTDSVSFQYDLESQANSQGRLSKAMMNDNFFYTYTYQRGGAVDTTALHLDGKSYVQVQQYNPNLSPDQLVFPDGSVQSYHYTPQGLAASISLQDAADPAAGEQTFLTFQAFDAAGNVEQALYGNGVMAQATYLPTGHLQDYRLTDANDSIFIDQQYIWDALFRIDTISDRTGQGYSQFFTYDKLSRLKTAQGIYGQKNYQYDPSGNLTLKDSVQYTYNNYQVKTGVQADNVKDTLFAATYDATGNMRSKTTIQEDSAVNYTYRYDVLNRLTGVVRNGDSLFTYLYDYTGRRVRKTNLATGVTSLYVSPQYELTVYPDSTVYTKNILSNSRLVATVSTSETNTASDGNANMATGLPESGTVYFHQDRLGNTRFTSGTDGAPQTRLVYKPYGEIFLPASSGPDNFRYKFGSKELDQGSGLYYFSARYYDPQTGRFITADTQLGGHPFQPGAFNRYAYTLNNPIRYSDPSGHSVTGDIVEDALVVGAEVAIDVIAPEAIPEEALLDTEVVETQIGVDVLEEGVEMNVSVQAEESADASSTSESMCFVAGTPIATEQGLKTIEDIRKGDKVWAWNEKTRRKELHRVEETSRRTATRVLRIALPNDTITVTPEHPFWVAGKWIAAEKLKPGDLLTSAAGETIAICKIVPVQGRFPVYNFEVEAVHNYYASESKVLVHNGSCISKAKGDDDVVNNNDNIVEDNVYARNNDLDLDAQLSGNTGGAAGVPLLQTTDENTMAIDVAYFEDTNNYRVLVMDHIHAGPPGRGFGALNFASLADWGQEFDYVIVKNLNGPAQNALFRYFPEGVEEDIPEEVKALVDNDQLNHIQSRNGFVDGARNQAERKGWVFH